MVKYSETELNLVFSALSDPTRRAILARLARGSATVSELAEPFGISLPAVSKHLRVLETASLIQRQVSGRIHHCRLDASPLQAARDWIVLYQQFWDSNLENLATYLETAAEEEAHGYSNEPGNSKS